MEEADCRAYYQFFRDEIEREDGITHNRMTTSLAFQGLLVAAMGFVMSGDVTNATGDLYKFKTDILLGLGLAGYVVAVVSTFGILATRLSILDTKKAFEQNHETLTVGGLCPQIHGQEMPFLLGSFYTLAVPWLFSTLWSAYIARYLMRMAHASDSFVLMLWLGMLVLTTTLLAAAFTFHKNGLFASRKRSA